MKTIDLNIDSIESISADMLFKNAPILIFGQAAIAAILATFLFEILGFWLSFGWALLVLSALAYRTHLYRAYKKRNHQNYKRWCQLFALTSLFSGVAWGMLGFMSVEEREYYLIVLVLCGMSTTSVTGSSVYMPACLAFIIPAILPVFFFTMSQEEGYYYLLMWLSLLYLTMLLGFSRVIHNNLKSSIKLRFENAKLVTDLTREKEQVEQSRQIAVEANTAKSNFLAAASHDLRQPMCSLGLFVAAIKQSNDEQERSALYPKLERSVESLGELLDALLDISKLDAKDIDIQLSAISINKLLSRLIEEFDILTKQQGLRLRFRPCNAIVTSDPIWLERILINFISNALRYTRHGGILVACRHRGDKLLIQVYDTGQGIDEGKQKIIFDEFQQLNNPSRDRTQGLGLGLAIVKRLGALLNHPIGLVSIPGKGSVFSVEVPVSNEPIIENIKPAYNKNALLVNKIILVIDDEQDILSGMAALLHQWGCKVILADSLSNALAQLEDCNCIPDLIISDYRLAENITGLDVLQKLQLYFNKSIPSLLLTGETSQDKIQEMNESVFRVLHKPVQPAKLRIMLNGLCQQES